MATEVSILQAGPIIPWFQSATTVQGYLWIEQKGQVVGGSNTVLNAVPVARTGDTPVDLKNWIIAALQNLMGAIAPDGTYTYPGPLTTANTWGIVSFEYGNTEKTYPFVAVAYDEGFHFGTLNIPAGSPPVNKRTIKFRIIGTGTPDQLSPAEKGIHSFVTANAANPILLALELNPE